MGRNVASIEPARDENRFSRAPASVCVEGPPQRQCYRAPEAFGNSPAASVVQLRKDMPALLFSADSNGVSGWQIHLALLRPDQRSRLDDLLDITISNQAQHSFFKDESLPGWLILVTAEYVWGLDEVHYDQHRYMVSAYVLKLSSYTEILRYYLEDRYMTARAYDVDKTDIIAAEKQEIISRLRRLKGTAKDSRH